jgi:hypothetical protein
MGDGTGGSGCGAGVRWHVDFLCPSSRVLRYLPPPPSSSPPPHTPPPLPPTNKTSPNAGPYDCTPFADYSGDLFYCRDFVTWPVVPVRVGVWS